jgi:hypothetical protein
MFASNEIQHGSLPWVEAKVSAVLFYFRNSESLFGASPTFILAKDHLSLWIYKVDSAARRARYGFILIFARIRVVAQPMLDL